VTGSTSYCEAEQKLMEIVTVTGVLTVSINLQEALYIQDATGAIAVLIKQFMVDSKIVQSPLPEQVHIQIKFK
jgi:hypothetical protein